jgi:hypothetical protein
MLAQMNQNANNSAAKGSVLAMRVDYSKGEFEGFGTAGVYGQAPNFVNPTASAGGNTNLGLIEVDGYFIRGDWTLQGQLSYGYQKDAAITADANGGFQTASWYGLSTLAAYKITPRLEAVGRFDYLYNGSNGGGLLGYGISGGNGIGPNGNLGCVQGAPAIDPGCNKGASRYALALGMNYVFNQYTMFKAEYRYDWSNLSVFENVSDGSYRKDNNVLGASVVVSF